MADRKTLILLGIIIAVILLGGFGLTSTGTVFGTAQINSISSTTLNNKPAVLVNLLASGGADALTAYLGPSDSRYPGTKNLLIDVHSTNNDYIYTLSERSGPSRAVQRLDSVKSCDGYIPFGTCDGLGGYSAFKQQCLAIQPTKEHFAYDGGDAANPKWRCYVKTDQWFVSDFDRTSAISEPTVEVNINDNNGAGLWFSTDLTRITPRAPLIAPDGQILGEASITSLAPQFISPPDESGIKAIRYAGDANSYIVVVDGSVDLDAKQAYLTFNQCQKQAANSLSTQQPLSFFGSPFILAGSYNDAQMTACINRLNSDVNALSDPTLQGSFKTLDTSKLAASRTVSLKNIFSIPAVNLWLYADKIGVQRANAVPSAVSCQNADLPGGAVGVISCSVTGTAGTIYWTASCPSPITVVTASGSVVQTTDGTKPFNVQVSTGSAQTTSACTITAKSTDLMTTKSSGYIINSKAVCQNSPRTGFYIDANCNEYCPVLASSCAAGTTFNASTCSCSGQPTVTPLPGGSNACLPVVQKTTTTAVGGFNIAGFNIGGTPVSSCVIDFQMVGLLILAVAALIYFRGNKRDGKAIGILGVVIMIASFLLDNALLVALGGAGILFVGVGLVIAYIFLKVVI